MSGERILLKRRKRLNVAACRAALSAHVEKPKVAGGFDYPTTLVGSTTWKGQDGGPVNVYYDPVLSTGGYAAAKIILTRMDALMTYLDGVFGVKGKAGNVIIAAISDATDGSAGAYHYGCSFNSDSPGSDWYEDYDSASVDEVFGLVMAEVCESYMGLQGRGWNCGGSGGEGLSRFLAEIVSGGASGALSAYASGPSWDGTDWISKDQGTDGDYPSIGCAILYCWWMTKLGYSVAKIVQAGEPDGTLATNYSALTGRPVAQAFADFKAAVVAAGGPTSDNPFNAPTPPYPNGGGGGSPPPPPPPSAPTATLAVQPSSVSGGQSVTLTWTTTGATSVLLADQPVAASGTLSATPSVSTQYTLVATGPGGSVTKTVAVTVVPPPPGPGPVFSFNLPRPLRKGRDIEIGPCPAMAAGIYDVTLRGAGSKLGQPIPMIAVVVGNDPIKTALAACQDALHQLGDAVIRDDPDQEALEAAVPMFSWRGKQRHEVEQAYLHGQTATTQAALNLNWPKVWAWIQAAAHFLGPLAVPIIEKYVATLPLTPAQRAAVDALIESLLAQTPAP